MNTHELLNINEAGRPSSPADQVSESLMRINAAMDSLRDQVAKYQRMHERAPERWDIAETLAYYAKRLEEVATEG